MPRDRPRWGGRAERCRVTPLACIACGRVDPCPDCRRHNKIPGWDEPMLPFGEGQEVGERVQGGGSGSGVEGCDLSR